MAAVTITFQKIVEVTSGSRAIAAPKMEMQRSMITHICRVRDHFRFGILAES